MIVSLGSALPSPLLPVGTSAAVIEAEMLGATGCGGGLTNASLATLALLLVSVAVERERSFTVALPADLGAANAAKGMIRIANDSKQAVNTLILPGVGEGDTCIQLLTSSRVDSYLVTLF